MKGSKAYSCNRCTRCFNTLKALNAHIVTSHAIPQILTDAPASQSPARPTCQPNPKPTLNRVCKHCKGAFVGTRGLSVHLSKDPTCRAMENDMTFQARPFGDDHMDLQDPRDNRQLEDEIDLGDQEGETSYRDMEVEWDGVGPNGNNEGQVYETPGEIPFEEHDEYLAGSNAHFAGDNVHFDENRGIGAAETEDDQYMTIFNHVLHDMATSDHDHFQHNNSCAPADAKAHNCPGELYPAEQEGEFIELYPDPCAGAPIRMATETEMRGVEPGDIGALEDPDNFELADFLLTSGLSAGDCERFMRLRKFRGQLPWRTNYMLMKDIDKLLCGPEWIPCEKLIKGNQGKQVLEWHKRNTLDVLKMLLAKKDLAQEMHWTPVLQYTSKDKKKQRYDDMRKSRWWWDLQKKVQAKDRNGTVIPLIFTSDKTPLLLFGDKKAYPVNMSIGNIPKHIWRKISSGATIPVAYLPADKILCETNPEKRRALKWKLFHECIEELLQPLTEAAKTGAEAVCGDGYVCHIYPFVASHIADFPEQCKIANIKNSFCPVCTIERDRKGDLGFNIPLRKHLDTVAAINKHQDKGSARFEALGLHSGKPYWETLPYIDLATFLTPDLLHQLHRGVFKDHLVKWVSTLKGDHIVDKRYMAMPRHSGIRHFKEGINGISKWTGCEMKEMAKVLLPVMADCDSRVVKVGRALLDFIYRAHASSMTDDDLDAMEEALRRFHGKKDIIEAKGLLKSDLGFHNIPKIHMMQHYAHSVRMLGTPDGFNSELSERLHIDFAKAGFRASNKVNDTVKKQMVVYIRRMEALAIHKTYLNERFSHGCEGEGDSGVFNGDEDEDVEGVKGAEGAERVGEVKGVEWLGGAGACTWVREARVQPVALADQSTLDQPGLSHLSPSIFYPKPNICIAKKPKFRLTATQLIEEYGTTNLLTQLPRFLSQRNPSVPVVTIAGAHVFKVWSRVYLSYSPPPFRSSEPATTHAIRTIPPKFNNHGQLKRFLLFDTVLVHMYPGCQGIHRYRAGRVRAIFELPMNIYHLYPDRLVYIDWFNSFSNQPADHLNQFTTHTSLTPDKQQMSSIVPLSDIHVPCHLAPKFSSLKDDDGQPLKLELDADVFKVCRQFFFNDFGSYFLYELMAHWELS